MKVVILAGGYGTRISEESHLRPKPMVEIGGKPILWHIMKSYAAYGLHEFIICCGYKGHIIKDYFLNYYMYQNNIIKYMKEDSLEVPGQIREPWKVTLVNTGLGTGTAGRIQKIRSYGDGEEFMMTYGDGVSDVNIDSLLQFHHSHGKIATITATKPAGRFGALCINKDNGISSFREKDKSDESWVNAGFAVFTPEIFDYLGDGTDMLERSPYEKLAGDGQMRAFKHEGFWSPMDTVRDRDYLEGLWKGGVPPWKTWEE